MLKIPLQGRNGKGSIFVWAAGNGGAKQDSCASDGYVNSIYTIAIGSANENGEPAYYDEECSAKMAVTFNHHSKPYSLLQVVSRNLSHTFSICGL